jgi:hypothetical protein
MERGCVEDQSQQVENSKVLRLVEDDTAALQHFSNTVWAFSPALNNAVGLHLTDRSNGVFEVHVSWGAFNQRLESEPTAFHLVSGNSPE